MKITIEWSHHVVVEEDSVTTKLWVIFQTSVKGSYGILFSDAITVGSTIQQEFFSFIFRFQLYRYGLKADITKTYRKIRLSAQHTRYQRILWREDEKYEVATYDELKTVTYGTATVSFLAPRKGWAFLSGPTCNLFTGLSVLFLKSL